MLCWENKSLQMGREWGGLVDLDSAEAENQVIKESTNQIIVWLIAEFDKAESRLYLIFYIVYKYKYT